MADLKPCPFCGGEAEILKYPRCERKYVVVCKNNLCNASIGQYSTSKENAVRAWNTRKPMEAVVAELEIEKETANRTYCTFEQKVDLGRVFGLERAISIVRGKE